MVIIISAVPALFRRDFFRAFEVTQYEVCPGNKGNERDAPTVIIYVLYVIIKY